MRALKRKQRQRWTEADLKTALSMLRIVNGRIVGIRAAARAVPKESLRRYAHQILLESNGLDFGCVKPKRLGRPPRLNESDEQELARAVRSRAASFQAMTPLELRMWAKSLYEQRNMGEGASSPDGSTDSSHFFTSTWSRGFKRRRGVSCRKAEIMTPGRVEAVKTENLREMFDNFASIYGKHGYGDHPERVWNVDETGMELGIAPRARVLAERGARHVGQLRSGDKTRMTAMCCISASGQVSPPSFFYKTFGRAVCKRMPETLMRTMLKYCPDDWSIMPTAKGVANGKCFRLWFKEWIRWLDKVVKRGPDEWHLLHLDVSPTHLPLVCCPMGADDGDSDLEWDISKIAEEHHIHLCYLKPHVTHASQPLDVGIFSPLKAEFDRCLIGFPDGRPLDSGGLRMPKYSDIPAIFAAAWARTMRPEVVRAAFRASGLFPLSWETLSKKAIPSSLAPTACTHDAELPPGREAPPAGHLPLGAFRGPFCLSESVKMCPGPGRTRSIVLPHDCGLLNGEALKKIHDEHEKKGCAGVIKV